jgi:hypothetical protein
MSRKIIFMEPNRKQQDLLREMKKNGSAQPCSQCGGVKYGVINGFLGHLLQKNPSIRIIGPEHLNSVVLICQRCGLITQHTFADMKQFVDEPVCN